MLKAYLIFLKAMGSHGRVLKKKIQFYGDVEGLLILSKVPECENWGDRYTSCGGPSGLVEGENDHCQVLG